MYTGSIPVSTSMQTSPSSHSEPEELIGPTPHPLHQEVRAVAATTLFGAFTRRGSSQALGNSADAALLAALREWADVVLVGAGTVRAEKYGPSQTPIAIVSRSLCVDTSLGVFDSPTVIILTPQSSLLHAASTTSVSSLSAAGAQVISTEDGSAKQIVDALHSCGFNRIVCEGGPGIYADLLANDLIDVLHLTTDPSVGSTDAHWGLTFPSHPEFLREFQLEHVATTSDSMLFSRYRRVTR